LLPLRIDEMQLDDNNGFTYFKITLHQPNERMLVQTKGNGHLANNPVQLLNYATLLPALWLEAPVPYALLTKEGEHLNGASKFI
jgi:hypothetical protein